MTDFDSHRQQPRRSRLANRRRWLGNRQGSNRAATAVVELALVLPVLMVFLLGTLETCSMIYRQQTLYIAAYEGCRVALIPRITRPQVDAAINTILTNRRVQGATITITPATFTTAPVQTLIEVRVSIPATGNSIVTPRFFTGRTLVGTCTMMKEF
ncbi:MAG: TadE/TadG family type IV pilus assembly protein [Planctomycetota bacterium]